MDFHIYQLERQDLAPVQGNILDDSEGLKVGMEGDDKQAGNILLEHALAEVQVCILQEVLVDIPLMEDLVGILLVQDQVYIPLESVQV